MDELVDGLFDDWERAWSGRDPHAFDAICLPELHYEDPLTPQPLASVSELARHARRLWRAFPDARVNQTGARLWRGDYAVAPSKLLGTHKRPLDGLPATQRALVVHCLSYAELLEGRIARVRVFFDVYAAAVQLGVLPRSGSAGERALMLIRGFGLRRP